MDYADNELLKFAENFHQEVLAMVEIDEEGALQEEKFTELIMDYLSEAGETDSPIVCTDIREDKLGRRLHKINGYALSENFETLDLFISIYKGLGNAPKTAKDEILTAQSLSQRFLKNALNGYFKEIEESARVFELAQLLYKIEKELIRINIFILTDGVFSSEISLETSLRNILVNYHIWDISRLFKLWSSKNRREAIEIDFEEQFGNAIPCLLMPTENVEYESFLAIVPGETLSQIYRIHGSRLLEQNVRAFLQTTGNVNKGIRKTILEEPHMFLAFNNGIAGTAQEIKTISMPDGSKAIKWVKDFQIVNGGQTTASIFHTHRKEKEKMRISEIYVQLKLTIVKNPERFSEIVSCISRYANSQNKVTETDLTSNHPFHVRIEELSRRVWAPDPTSMHNLTRWFYERARGQYNDAKNKEFTPAKKKAFEVKNPRKQLFNKEDLAKFVHSWEQRPWHVARSKQKNFIEYMKHIKKDLPDNIFFEDTIAKAILFRTAEHEYGTGARAIGDLRFLVVPYTLSWLNYKTDGKIDLYKIWKNQAVSEELRSVLRELLFSVNQFLKVNAPNSLVSEWAKKEDCWKRICAEDFPVHLNLIRGDFIDVIKASERYKVNDSELAQIKRKEQEQELYDIPYTIWKKIETWGRTTRMLSPYQNSMVDTISRIVRDKKSFTDIQLNNGLSILEHIAKENPLLFESDDLAENIKKIEEETIVEISLEEITSLIKWDKKYKKLYLRDFNFIKSLVRYSKLSSAQKKYANIILNKAYEAGFNNELVE